MSSKTAHASLGDLTALDLAEYSEPERTRLLICRAAREIGYARAVASTAEQLAASEDWPRPDTPIGELVHTIYLMTTGTALPEGSDEQTRLLPMFRVALRNGFNQARRALRHGIPDGIAERIAYQARLAGGQQ